MTISEKLKGIVSSIVNDLEKGRQEAITLGKKFLGILLEQHGAPYDGRVSLVPQIVALNWMSKNNITNLLTETHQTLLDTLKKEINFEATVNCATLINEASCRGMNIWPIDAPTDSLGQFLPLSIRTPYMIDAIRRVGQDAVLVTGINHLDLAADQSLNDQYHIVAFNAACLSELKYLMFSTLYGKEQANYLNYAYNQDNAKQLDCYIKEIDSIKSILDLHKIMEVETSNWTEYLKTETVLEENILLAVSNLNNYDMTTESGIAFNPLVPIYSPHAYTYTIPNYPEDITPVQFFKTQIERLMNNLPSYSSNVLPKLHIASNCGKEEEAQSYLTAGHNPNLQEAGYKQTALHICRSTKVAKLLLEAGADPTIENKDGDTPYEFHCFMYCRVERDEIQKPIMNEIAHYMNELGISYEPCKCPGDDRIEADIIRPAPYIAAYDVPLIAYDVLLLDTIS